MSPEAGNEISRRKLLQAGGGLALLALAPAGRVERLLRETAAPARDGRFLRAAELDTLRAVTARLVPGPPDDPGPGALEARAAEAIDLFLGAFEVDPPLIHAGGPFSNRAGAARDDFTRFLPLDRQAELGWRIRLEGSRGRPEREFAGPVVGLQEVYRTGLARLDRLARSRGAAGFATAPAAVQDALLSSDDPVAARFAGAALGNTLEAMFGPPEYGGNHALVAWTRLGWQGDTQPRGFVRAAVTQPDSGSRSQPRSGSGTADPRAAALVRLVPALDGRRASLDAWWAGYRGLGR